MSTFRAKIIPTKERLARFTANFWRKVDRPKLDDNLCWNWTGSASLRLCGLTLGMGQLRARNVCWFLMGQRFREGFTLRCLCGNDRCINPLHMLHEPMNAKLSEIQVREIKQKIKNGERKVKIAAQYGVSKVTVMHIAQNKSWKSLED